MSNRKMSDRKNKLTKSALGVVLAVGISLTVAGWVTRAAAGVEVHLRVEGQTAPLFDGKVVVGDCVARDNEGKDHALSGVALCALVGAAEANDLALGLQDFGWGLFIADIGDDVTPADWSLSWSLWVNDEPAAVGADAYQVVEGDELLLAFSGYPAVPLRVTAPEKVLAGEQFVVSAVKRIGAYDENYNWQGEWQPAVGADLHVGSELLAVGAEGQTMVEINAPGVVNIWADGDGLVRSSRWQLEVEEEKGGNGEATPSATPNPLVTVVVSPAVEPTPLVTVMASPAVEPTPTVTVSPLPTRLVMISSPTPSSVPVVTAEQRTVAAGQAMNYLRRQQGADGKVDGDIVTAWSAMAFGADGQRAEMISAGGKTLWDGLGTVVLASATDLERQIMAVRAAGGNPRAWQGRNLVQELRGFARSGQLGAVTLINDDIFGILALLAADEPVGAAEMEQAVRVVISRQGNNGAEWSIDLTAAAIQALRAYSSRGGQIDVEAAVERARLYLRDQQDRYGGWGENLASTAWGIQAVVSLGEDPAGWINQDGRTPWQAMWRYQNSTGGFGWRSSEDVSSFMTAYAVPALLGKAWPITVVPVIAAGEQDGDAAAGEPALTSPPTNTAAAVEPMVAGVLTEVKEPIRSDEREILAGMAADSGDGEQPALTTTGGVESGSVLGMIQPGERDWRFVLSLFSLANMGVGVAVARLTMRI